MTAGEKQTSAPKPQPPKKATMPPPGRKLTTREAMEQVNKQFAKAFEKLAK